MHTRGSGSFSQVGSLRISRSSAKIDLFAADSSGTPDCTPKPSAIKSLDETDISSGSDSSPGTDDILSITGKSDDKSSLAAKETGIQIPASRAFLMTVYEDPKMHVETIDEIDKGKIKRKPTDENAKKYLTGPNIYSEEDKLKYLESISKTYTPDIDYDAVNNNPTRRYFETHLAYEVIKNDVSKVSKETVLANYNALYSLLSEESKEKVTKVFSVHPDIAFHIDKLRVEISALEEQRKTMTGDFTEIDAKIDELNQKIKGIKSNQSYRSHAEYYDLYTRIGEGKDIAFSDLKAEEREVLQLFVKISYLGTTLANGGGTEIVPLDLYSRGYYAAAHRGKGTEKKDLVPSETMGLVLPGMPVPSGDIISAASETYYTTAPNRYNYRLSGRFIHESAHSFTHPFANSISGTILAQIRCQLLLLKLNQSALCPKESLDKSNQLTELKTFYRLFISVLLFGMGGHSLNEFTRPFTLPQVRDAFAAEGLEEFGQLNLETLFSDDITPLHNAMEKTYKYSTYLLEKDGLADKRKTLSKFSANSLKGHELLSVPKPIVEEKALIDYIASEKDIYLQNCKLLEMTPDEEIVTLFNSIQSKINAKNSATIKTASAEIGLLVEKLGKQNEETIIKLDILSSKLEAIQKDVPIIKKIFNLFEDIVPRSEHFDENIKLLSQHANPRSQLSRLFAEHYESFIEIAEHFDIKKDLKDNISRRFRKLIDALKKNDLKRASQKLKLIVADLKLAFNPIEIQKSQNSRVNILLNTQEKLKLKIDNEVNQIFELLNFKENILPSVFVVGEKDQFIRERGYSTLKRA